MTSKELKRMCVYELDIPGMTKKPKDVVIGAILEKYGAPDSSPRKSASFSPAKAMAPPKSANPLTQVQGTFTSLLNKPSEKFGNRTTTMIRVSSGAAHGNFDVVGKTVGQVSQLLREVLNVDKMSTGIVNGAEKSSDYVLAEGDNLEFLKPAGNKG